MNAAYCSLTGARTFLDTNLVHLEVMDATQLTSAILGEQAAGVPEALLPDIVHESVHHWCFNTPLGLALTANYGLLVEHANTDATAAIWGRYLIRHKTMFEALRPFIEGLACFAEFDMFPGEGNLRVVPLEWVRRLARPGEKATTTSDTDNMLRTILARMRLNESTARRKDTLLAQPLNPMSRGGYLTGYLMVKGWHARMLKETRLAEDGELFISFLRAYLFADYRLAGLQLHPIAEDEHDDIEHEFFPLRYLNDRLELLEDGAAAAERLRQFNIAYRPDIDDDQATREREVADAIGVPYEYQNVYEERMTAFGRRINREGDNDGIEALRHYERLKLRNRDWICVASAPGRVVATSDGAVRFYRVGDQFPAISRTPRGESGEEAANDESVHGDHDIDGAAECWMGPYTEGAVYVVASALGVHHHVGLWTVDDGPVREFVGTVRSNRYMVELTDTVRKMFDEWVNRQAFCAPLEEAVKDRLEPCLLGQASMAVKLFDGGDEFKQALWDDGFFGLFNDLALIRAVSALSLLDSVRDSRVNAKALVPELDASRQKIVGYAWTYAAAKDANIIDEAEDRLRI